MVPKLKFHQIYLKMCTLVNLKALTENLILAFKILHVILFLGKLVPKLKYCQIYLKICILADLKVLNTNLTSLFYLFI